MATWVAPNHDGGAVGLDPKSEFARDLLQGRAPEMGLFLAGPNKDSPDSASIPVFDLNAGDLTIG